MWKPDRGWRIWGATTPHSSSVSSRPPPLVPSLSRSTSDCRRRRSTSCSMTSAPPSSSSAAVPWPPLRISAAARPRLVAVEQPVPGAIDYSAMIAAARDTEVETVVDPDSACMIMYTSGTTGRPKGAILSHDNVIWNCLNVLVDLDMRSDEVTLVTAPMFHTAALNMTCLPTMLKGGHLLYRAAIRCASGDRRHRADACDPAVRRADHVRRTDPITTVGGRRSLVTSSASLRWRTGADIAHLDVPRSRALVRAGVWHD